MVLSVITTIRLEQRWLVTSHLFLLLGVACLYRQTFFISFATKALRIVPVLCLVLLSIFMNLEYRKTIDGVFFRSAQIGTGSLIKMVMPFFEGSAQYESPIYIVDPTPDANWDAVLRPLILANTELSLPRLITVTDQTDIP